MVKDGGLQQPVVEQVRTGCYGHAGREFMMSGFIIHLSGLAPYDIVSLRRKGRNVELWDEVPDDCGQQDEQESYRERPHTTLVLSQRAPDHEGTQHRVFPSRKSRT